MKNEINYILAGEDMKSYGHTQLLHSTEYAFTYLNENGTKTIYIFTAPLQKKVIQIENLEDNYLGKGNYFEVKMPKVFNQYSGINIAGNMEVFPKDNKNYKAVLEVKENIFGQKRDCVVYKDFYEGQVDLICYVTGFGLNSEIVIPKYMGNNTFQLKIKQPEELYVVADSPDYVQFRTEDAPKSTVYTPLAVDAEDNRTYKNYVDVTEDNSDGSYIITYRIDEAFLKDPNTKYPVTLNQSIYHHKHSQSDTAMYSETGDNGTHHLSPYMLLGDKTIKGEGWGFVRFEELYEMYIFPEKVISAEYSFKNLFDNDKEVVIGAHAIRNDWCSVNTRWRTKPGYDNLPVQTVRVKNKGIYSVDITKLFIEIMKSKFEDDPPYSVRNSFFIKSLTKDTDLLLASGDSGIFSPYLKIVVNND